MGNDWMEKFIVVNPTLKALMNLETNFPSLQSLIDCEKVNNATVAEGGRERHICGEI